MIKEYIQLLRVPQWYKNLVVFLALFFSGNIMNISLLSATLGALLSLVLVSSANYIINDLADARKDKLHPEKKSRPIASGKIAISTAVVLALLLVTAGIVLAYRLDLFFLYAVLGMIILTQLYTFFLKQVVFADILAIATLFVLRAVAGALVIHVSISPWLVLCPFFLSLFLSIGKRHGELHLLQQKASLTRKVLQEYSQKLTDSLMIISTTLLVISYALYSFLSEQAQLLYTLPFALFVMFRFYYLISTGSIIARYPEKVLWDLPMAVGMILWMVVTALVIYW